MLYINTNKEELNIKGKSIKIRITKKRARGKVNHKVFRELTSKHQVPKKWDRGI